MPKLTQSSSAMKSARNAGLGSVLFWNCWQLPREFGAAPATVCSTLDKR